MIKVEINASASPIGDNPQRLFDAIPQYLTETLGLKGKMKTFIVLKMLVMILFIMKERIRSF